MASKAPLYFGSILVSVSLLASLGCSRIFGGSSAKKDTSTIQVKMTQFDCLKSMPGQLKDYISDKADANEVAQAFGCIDTSLSAFANFTEGANSNQYSSTELTQFLNRYMLSENQMSKSLMYQLMKVKVFVIGGSDSILTREEITSIHAFLQVLTAEAQNLRGHWKTLLFVTDVSALGEKDLTETHSLVKKALADILGASNAAQSTYSWDDFQSLINETESLLQAQEQFAVIKKWMPLINAVHSLFMGNAVKSNTVAGWTQVANWAADAYTLMGRYYYQVLHVDLKVGASWRQIIHFFDGALNLLSSSPQMANNGILRAQDIDTVIDEVFNLKLISGDLTSDILKETYKRALVLVFKGEQINLTPMADWESIAGFDQVTFNNLKFEYNIWKVTQLKSIEALEKNASASYGSVVAVLKQTALTDADLQPLALAPGQSDVMMKAWSDWTGILSSPYPLIFENGASMEIPASADQDGANLVSFSLVNGLRTLVRFIEMGYGQAGTNGATDLWSGVVSEAAIRTAEGDFEKLGRAIHFLDPRQVDSGGLAYANTNYFTFSSHGAANESAQQLLELFALMVSGGKVTADQIMTDLAADHCLTTQLDASFHQPIATQSCFEASFKAHFAERFATLSALVLDVQSGHTDMNQMIQQLEIISNDPTKPAGTIEYPEMRMMGSILYYLEALMAVYDKNHDQNLSFDEVVAAYPRFEAMVEQMSPLKSWFAEDAFLYIVYRGQKPATDSLGKLLTATGDFASFVIERNIGLKQPVARMNLLQVIAVLKQDSDATAAKFSAQTATTSTK